MDIQTLNQKLQDYDAQTFADLEPILEEIAFKSKALANNLRRCFTKFQDTERYLKAYKGEPVSSREADLEGEEFMIFREYVRLLRSCTIMCGSELSAKFKEIFLDFFSGTRLKRAQELGLKENL